MVNCVLPRTISTEMSIINVLQGAKQKSSRSQMFFKIGVLKTIAIFTGKHLWETCNSIKKGLQHKCFPVNIAICLSTTFFKEHLWRLLLLKTSLQRKCKYFESRNNRYEIFCKNYVLKEFNSEEKVVLIWQVVFML